MRINILVLFAIILLTAVGCKSNGQEEIPKNLDPNAIKAEVKEVIQTSNYTYLKLDDYGDTYWGAVTKMNVKEGETLYYKGSMEMKDFHSQELDRTFESLLFIENASKEPILAAPKSTHGSANNPIAKSDINIEPAEGGITIAELYADKKDYENKTIKIKGKVTKFNPNIMGKNWVHLQDGTEENGNFDITITTDDVVRPGEIVTFEGSVALDKDFGYGYKYDIIIEVGKLDKTTRL